MAVNCTCFSSTQTIPIHKFGSFLKYPNKELKSKRSSVSLPLKIAPVRRRITASIKNKVYEDKSEGIICYEDEHGEIICEGYDEGPCFQRIPKPIYHPRDAEIRNVVIRQGWLQIAKGEESSEAVEEGNCNCNCNGFNSFR